MSNILTFDIEDWFHILEYQPVKSVTNWNDFEERIDIGLNFILSELKKRNISATFFILGWIAEKHPEKIAKIVDNGHEIGNHTYSHRLVFEQSKDEFRLDVERAMDAIYPITREATKMFRAPGFSIKQSSQWAFKELSDLGFEIDASVFLSRRAHGGFSEIDYQEPFVVDCGNNLPILEFPTVPVNFGFFNAVCSGGGYFRICPNLIRKFIFRDVQRYSMWYFHPRDFDHEQPILPGLSLSKKFKCYVGLKSSSQKFVNLLDEISFCTIGEAQMKLDLSMLPQYRIFR